MGSGYGGYDANLFVVLHHTQQCVDGVEDAHGGHSLVIPSLLVRARLNHLVERHGLPESKQGKSITTASMMSRVLSSEPHSNT